MADYLNDQPILLPTSVKRVKEDGTPTQDTLMQEGAYRGWFVRTVVNLDTRITTIQSDTDTNTASIVAEQTARTSADAALASDILTVSASTGLGTANGAVALVAEAGPTGYTAQYSWKLTAGNASVGMRAMAKDDGTSAIAFSLGSLLITDPNLNGGALGNIMYYDTGLAAIKWGVPFINSTENIEENAATSGYGFENLGTNITLPIVSRGGDFVIIATISNTTATLTNAATPTHMSFPVDLSGTPIGTVDTVYVNVGKTAGVDKAEIAPVSKAFILNVAAGSYNVTVNVGGSAVFLPGSVVFGLVALELLR